MATQNSVNNIGVTQTGGTNNTTLATTAFVQSAVTGGSGALTKIAAVNTAGAATVNFSNDLSATYDDYLLIIKYAVPATTSVTARIRIGTGGTPTYQATNYVGTGSYANTGSPAGQTSGSTAIDFTLQSRWANTTTTGMGGQILICNANDGTNNKTINAVGMYQDSSGSTSYGFLVPGQWTSSTVITSLQFLTSSGNITLNGVLYGLSN